MRAQVFRLFLIDFNIQMVILNYYTFVYYEKRIYIHIKVVDPRKLDLRQK